MASRIFISHGHNETVKLKLRTFIKERLGLDPVVLLYIWRVIDLVGWFRLPDRSSRLEV